jgi:putative CocE/NonD family hydrolase
MPALSRTRISSLAILTGVLSTLLVAAPQQADAAPNGYVRMSDGVLIAVNVRMPDGFVEGKQYPTIFEMSGYDGGSAVGQTLMGDIADVFGYQGDVPLREDSRQVTQFFNQNYVTVHASVRGTGCSGGDFDLFSWQSALDGRELIDWIAKQPWSNGGIGIMGHSYGGITGFMVAATQPPQLDAVSVSGLIDDIYRGIVYPGGVSNYGFPLLWAGAVRPAYDAGGGTAPGIVRTQDTTCMQNVATRKRTLYHEGVFLAGLSDVDGEWYREHSLVSFASRIEVPIHITGAYQDEQTGPRFPHLFELIGGVPKRMVMTNGDHGTQLSGPDVISDRVAWMDHWIRGEKGGFGKLRDDRSSVLTLLELHREGEGLSANGKIRSRTFPLEQTRWTEYHLRAGNGLTAEPAAAGEGSDRYFSGSPRQSWSYQAGPTAGSPFTTEPGPDELTYRTEPFARNTAIAGPIVATVFASSTAPDTEIFVQLIDEGPDGARTYLQRGMLRASHREVDPERSDWVTTRDGRRVMYRPFHPHVNPTLITPNQVYEYVIEVFPVGHVFRAGHRLAVKIHTPPLVDSYYAYVPRRVPAVNTVLHDAEHPSRIQLPVIPLNGAALGEELACGEQHQVRCVE